MSIATFANIRTTWACNKSIEEGFHVAFQGGMVLGFCLVAVALLHLQVLVIIYRALILPTSLGSSDKEVVNAVRGLFEAVAGYGLGGSTVALFARVGGGIYTKAADVGADLAGKVCEGLEEDSPDNPGTIADNVGDNVGDIAGMGADLFGSLAESACAALVISAQVPDILKQPDATYFPIMVPAVGIIASLFSVMAIRLSPVTADNVENKLKHQLTISTSLMTLFIFPLVFALPPSMSIEFAGKVYIATRWSIFFCILTGLWTGLAIGFTTEYYTSNKYPPV